MSKKGIFTNLLSYIYHEKRILQVLYFIVPKWPFSNHFSKFLFQNVYIESPKAKYF